jgi:hypothetical protein
MRHRLTASVALLLAGCGSAADLLSGGRVEGDSESVTVKAESAPQAAPLALAHCHHYDRGTQFDREVATGAYLYRCVASD